MRYLRIKVILTGDKLVIGGMTWKLLLMKWWVFLTFSFINCVWAETNSDLVDESDQIITNRAFRASNGSLSKWSINSSWSYNAGSIEKPFDVERPNITAAGDVAELQGLSGNIGISYRLTKLNRLSFATGLNMVAPFHQDISTDDPVNQREFDQNHGKVDLNDPSLTFSRVFRFRGIQTIASFMLMQYTTGIYVDRGYDFNSELSFNTMYEFGNSGFSAGALVYGSRNHFDSNQRDLRPLQVESTLGILPQFEYVINQRFNLRTIFRSWWYQNSRAQDPKHYSTLDFTQSVGVGISITRDIFLYPNIQFAPDNLRAEKTNVGLNANINIF